VDSEEIMARIFGAAVMAAVLGVGAAAQAQYLIVGNDEKGRAGASRF
jgi:hypothetical protein